MDEYDVFMDAVNRRIATQTLLEFALEQDDMQLVLLTPQVRKQNSRTGLLSMAQCFVFVFEYLPNYCDFGGKTNECCVPLMGWKEPGGCVQLELLVRPGCSVGVCS
jgi:hypothetical protein